MKKLISILVLLLTVTISFAQKKPQSVAYIDMEYILQNVPEYVKAQSTLDSKVLQWKKRLDDQERFIEVLKTDLANEKAILTKDLIEEKEEEIELKQEELRRLESLYFGPNGDLYNLRKKLVAPVQDQIYTVVQEIADVRNYDFIYDKSSEPVMLYSNKKYDISDLVLTAINTERKIEKLKDKKQSVKKPKANNPKVLQAKKKQQRLIAQKKKELDKKLAQKKLAQQKAADKKKEILKQRQEKRKEILAKKVALKKKQQELAKQKIAEAKRKREEAKKKRAQNKNKEDDNN